MSARPGPEDPTTPERPAGDAPRAAVEPSRDAAPQVPEAADADRSADEETTASATTVTSASSGSAPGRLASDGTEADGAASDGTETDGGRGAAEPSLPEERSSGRRTDSSEEPEQIAVRAGSVRRAPVYRRFFLMGALLGTVIALVLSPFGNFAASDQVRALLPMPWGLVMFALPFGGLLGLLVALLLDRRSRRPRRAGGRATHGDGSTDRR